MNFKKVLLGGLLLALVVTALAPAPTYAQSGNILQNPGLNQPYADGNKQAQGWGRWFQLIDKPADATALNYAANPNFSAETNASGKFPQLVLEGDSSQHIGRQYDPWIGGVWQTVGNIPPGSQVRFCAYSRLYAQNANFGKEASITGLNGRSQVGIFPNGAANWDNTGIVWSGTANPHDTWVNICTTAGPVGDTGQVTVFTRNDWRGSGAIHLDAWWDQAELVIVDAKPAEATAQPQPQATQAQSQAQPQATPQPQPTAQTDASGGVVHTVAAGDTLFGLSIQYNVPLDQIYTLNGLNGQSILSIGQKIIIKGGAGVPAQQPTVAPTAAAQPATTPETAATSAAPAAATTPNASGPTPASSAPTAPTAASDKGQLCLLAFNDVNGDGLRQSSEAAVAGAKFVIVDAQGATVETYVSTDSSNYYCVKELTPGSYNVSVQPAPNTQATSDKRWGVPLTSGSTVNINFGSRGGGSSASSSDGSSTPSAAEGKSSGSNVGGIVAGIGGLVLLLAAGVIGAFVIARRRA